MDFNELVQQGLAFFNEEKLDLALGKFEAALALQPDNDDVRNLIESLKERSAIDTNMDQSIVNELQSRKEALGITDVDKAIAEYIEALMNNPNDATAKSGLASAYYIRGLTFTSTGEHAESIKAYSMAIENDSAYLLAFKNRGRAYLEVGNHDLAICDFKEVIKINPAANLAKEELADAYSSRGIAYYDKSDYNNAITDFEEALRLRPDNDTTREFLDMAKARLQGK